MKRFLSRYWKIGATVVFGLVVYCFWRFRYPFALTYQEQLQLFLFDSDYFAERMAEPGGFARYVAEFLVQFYNGMAIGAAILAILYMLIQRLTWRLMRTSDDHYALSFVPVLMLWYAMGDESVMLTYVVALAMGMAGMTGWRWDGKDVRGIRWCGIVVLIPVIYWLIGPMVVVVALAMLPWTMGVAAVIYATAWILLSAHWLPFSLLRIVTGISYYRFPETLPYMLMAIPVVVLLLRHFASLLPKTNLRVGMGEAVLMLAVGIALVRGWGFDAKKYELMEYDYLVRIQDWNGIIAKAEQQTPDLPMSVSATNLALGMTNQLGQRAFDFYQRGSEGLLPGFERNFATTQLTGEIYFWLGLVNTAQRLAFESMEAIPNYNKSGRVVKRLAETNLINGEYKVAEKYLRMLEKTVFYRPWVQRMRALLGDEKAIDSHPLYGTLRQLRLTDDFLFSEDELDKICGQLFMQNQKNQMAVQYLLMAPLLDKDIERFMPYVQIVQNRVNYNPRHIQEGIALAFMQQRQQPPQGVVSPLILQQCNEFARVYSTGSSSPELGRFRNTAWYYLTVGK